MGFTARGRNCVYARQAPPRFAAVQLDGHDGVRLFRAVEVWPSDSTTTGAISGALHHEASELCPPHWHILAFASSLWNMWASSPNLNRPQFHHDKIWLLDPYRIPFVPRRSDDRNAPLVGRLRLRNEVNRSIFLTITDGLGPEDSHVRRHATMHSTSSGPHRRRRSELPCVPWSLWPLRRLQQL